MQTIRYRGQFYRPTRGFLSYQGRYDKNLEKHLANHLRACHDGVVDPECPGCIELQEKIREAAEHGI